MHLYKLLPLTGLVLLTGCAQLAQAIIEAGSVIDPNKTYPVANIPAPSNQVNFGLQAGEQYQTIAVNTPNGLVYKRCKVLNGQVVACF